MKENHWLLQIASRNLVRHWRRSLIAILSIASGFAAINLFEGYIAGAERLFEDTYTKRLMYGQILVHPDADDFIEPEQQKAAEALFKNDPEIENQVRFLNVGGLVTNGKTDAVFMGYGYDILAGAQMRSGLWRKNTLFGRPLLGGDPNESPDDAVIGQGMAHLMDCHPGAQPIGVTVEGGYSEVELPFHCPTSELQLTATTRAGRTNAAWINVVGIVDAVYAEADSRYIAMPLAKAQALFDTSAISMYSLALKDPSRQFEVAARLQEKFDQAHLPLRATRWKDHKYGQIYVQSMDFLNVFRDFTLIVALAIVSLSVFTLLTRLVNERTREIGTLRSLGFRSAEIRNLFLAESFLIAAFGNLIGAIVAIILGQILSHAGILYKIGILVEKVPFRIAIRGEDFLVSGLILTALAMSAAWLAIRAILARKIPDCLSGLETDA